MIKYLLGFFCIWSLGATFLALGNPKFKTFVDTYISPYMTNSKNIEIKEDIIQEYEHVKKFIYEYYTISRNTVKSEKLKTLSTIFDFKANATLWNVYNRELTHLLSKKGSRKIDIKKITRSGIESVFQVYSVIKQDIPNKNKDEFLVLIEVKLKKRQHNSEVYKIAQLKERILKKPNFEMLDRTIYVSKSISSNILFPCQPQSFLNSNQKLGFKVLSEKNQVRFNPLDNFSKPFVFKAICNQRRFKITLAPASNELTLFQSYDLSDGTLIKRKLSEKEKASQSAKQVGLKIRFIEPDGI